ncbi:unnamed protein product [Penicillium salamii]|uniref:HMA domain-containing protein n=1 Tax=Penicillium salamii TaxID=1612424 RepID=A0A9W4NEJ5_9EURO|nr:unnamed protein product [Penicillium salamii]CAG8019088.1 unnamed protein product [Penicillium salamii]CAG8126497.1 unnamed protein product [Penicillium salamii]CAG8306362.1 unnamed protein product [Penicillium salamii]CAG8319555.1 unnamed protein product [Penicillium salamii]
MGESQPQSQSKLTTFLVDNLHCPSCVTTVQETLGALRPAPFSVSTSIVLHEIKVSHPITLSATRIARALEDAGFELDSISPSTSPDGDPEAEQYTPRSKFRDTRDASYIHSQSEKHIRQCEACSKQLVPSSTEKELQILTSSETMTSVMDDRITGSKYRVSLAISGMSCSSCVGKITTALQGDRPWILSLDVNLLTSSAVVVLLDRAHVDEVVDTIRESGYSVEVVDIEEIRSPRAATAHRSGPTVDAWRASYIIEGMTCSSCVGKVTDTLNQNDWITKVDVNLVAGSATVEYQGKDHMEDIAKIIGGLGYKATVSDVESRDPTNRPTAEREIHIQIDGMHCDQCPQRVIDALSSVYGDKVELLELPTNGTPRTKVRYLPEVPTRTIRHIMQTIGNVDKNFTVSVYHPPTLEERSQAMHRRHQWQIARRLILSVIIAIPTFIIGIVYMSLVPANNPGKMFMMEPLWAGQASRTEWALFILATPVYFYSANLFHRKTAHELYSLWRPGSQTPILRRFLRFGSMDMLMCLGTSIAYFASIAILAINATAPVGEKTYHTESFFDSVVFLTMFLMIGRLLEAYSKAKAGDAVGLLGKLRPTEAVLVEQAHGDQAEVTSSLPIDQLEFGDVVRVANGASPPYDGTIINGTSRFDESSLTGESLPVEKTVGNEVFSGTINQADPVLVNITRLSGDSMLDQVIGAVREGQIHRAPIERTADLLTSYFVPVVTLIAVLDWLIWLALGLSGRLPAKWQDGPGGWEFWSLQFAISVFVVACPCGIGLAAPTALFVGGGLAAQHGILVKGGGEAFQEASQLDCVVFDKTGTITEGGQPSITNHQIVHTGNNLADLWGAVLALEQNSSHPIAKAVVSFALDQQPSAVKTTTVKEIPGKGLQGHFAPVNQDTNSTIEMIIGNEALMQDYEIDVSPAILATLLTWKQEAKSVVLVGSRVQASETSNEKAHWQLSFVMAVADPVRPEAVEVLQALQNRGIDVWMISGDNPVTAQAVGRIVGIPTDNIIAGVLPEQKAEKVRYLQKTLQKQPKAGWFGSKKQPSSTRAIVAMIGDGINDSPALTAADVGIAIGSGSDIAISAAEFVLISSGLTSLLTLVDLSRVVFRRIKFNFGWALIYNCIAVPVAAGVFYPIVSNGTHIRLDPVWASLAMALSSVSVICSSLLMRTRLPLVGFRAKK